jgi:hypothetical protein
LHFPNYNDAFSYAENDIKANWERYRREYLREVKVNKRSVAYKNIVLNTEFNKYLVEHPEIADKIPDNALVVILPDDDPALCRKNLSLARRHRKKDQAVVHVRVKKLAPPPKSRLVQPRLKVAL